MGKHQDILILAESFGQGFRHFPTDRASKLRVGVPILSHVGKVTRHNTLAKRSEGQQVTDVRQSLPIGERFHTSLEPPMGHRGRFPITAFLDFLSRRYPYSEGEVQWGDKRRCYNTLKLSS